MSDIKANPEDFHLCYECACFKHKDRMQKYECRLCGGRKCTDLHTVDENLTCEYCGTDQLCNDCKAFAKCCHIYEEGQFHLRKDKTYLKITA